MIEQSSHRAPLAASFSQAQFIFYLVIVALGLILRWAGLDERPMHHDESIHAMFARNFQAHPDVHFYRNDPVYHGPFLYNLLRMVYDVFGPSTYAARGLVAFMGSAFLFVPLLFKRFISTKAVLASTTFIALSPSLIYWSRFLIHDFFVVASVMLMFWGAAVLKGRNGFLLFFLGLAIHFTVKANVYVHLAILAGYLIFEAGLKAWQAGKGQKPAPSLTARALMSVYRSPGAAAFSALAGAIVFVYFYTSGLRFTEGLINNAVAIFTGGVPESVAYWLGQHAIERIPGPFSYYFYFLSWYELPFIIAFLAHLFLFYRRAGRTLLTIAVPLWLAGAAFTFYHFSTPVTDHPIWDFLKFKNPMDIFLFFVFASHAVILTAYHLLRREEALAVTGYMFMAVLVTYSYLGEKTPWLSLYPLLTGLVYLTLYFDDFVRRIPAETPVWKVALVAGTVLLIPGFVIALQDGITDGYVFLAIAAGLILSGLVLAFLFRTSHIRPAKWLLGVFVICSLNGAYLSNFRLDGDASEIISQVHTTKEFKSHALRVRADVESRPMNSEARVFVTGVSVWPTNWYLRDLHQISYGESLENPLQYDYIFKDWTGRPEEDNVEGFRAINLRLRGWFVPDYSKMSMKALLTYYWNRTPWNPVGYQWVVLHVRE